MTKFHFWLESFCGTSFIYTQKVESDSGKKNDHFSIHYVWTESSRAFILNCNENKDDQIERRLY